MTATRESAISYARMNKEAKLARRVWGERAGRTAFTKDTPRSENPFIRLKRIPEMYDHWLIGWDAMEEEKAYIDATVREQPNA